MIWIHMDDDVDRGEPPIDGRWYQNIQGAIWWDEEDGDADAPQAALNAIWKIAPEFRPKESPRWLLRFQMDVRHRPALIELCKRKGWHILGVWPGWQLEKLNDSPYARRFRHLAH